MGKKFYTRDRFKRTKDIGKAIVDTSCIVLQSKDKGGLDGCINRDVTNDIVAFAKFMVTEGDEAFTADIPYSLAEEIGFSEKQVFSYALESAQQKNPLILAELDNGNYLLHTGKVFGAATILYDGVLSYVAQELDDDYYIFPANEDYLTVVRKSGVSLPEARFYVAPDEEKKNFMSDEVMVYYKDHDLVRWVGANDQNVIYLQKGVMRYE